MQLWDFVGLKPRIYSSVCDVCTGVVMCMYIGHCVLFIAEKCRKRKGFEI